MERIARDQGYAVVIGHPHEQTISALEVWIADARAASPKIAQLKIEVGGVVDGVEVGVPAHCANVETIRC